MLRAVLTLVAGLVFAASLFGFVAGAVMWQGDLHPHAVMLVWLAVQSGVLFAGIFFERTRYKAIETHAPGPGWQASGERFVDPTSGELVQVWYNPVSGERRYVAMPPG